MNHLSGALLTLLLLPRLVKTAQKNGTVSRVVTVTSAVHAIVDLGKDHIPSDAKIFETMATPEYYKNGIYPATKRESSSTFMSAQRAEKGIIEVLNVLFTRALNTRIPGSVPLVVNCVNPAFCLSQLRRSVDHGQPEFKELEKTARTSEEGSRQLIFSAIGPDPTKLDGAEAMKLLGGAYISNNSVEAPSIWVQSDEGAQVQEKLWVSCLCVTAAAQSCVLMCSHHRMRPGTSFAKLITGSLTHWKPSPSD